MPVILRHLQVGDEQVEPPPRRQPRHRRRPVARGHDLVFTHTVPARILSAMTKARRMFDVQTPAARP